MSTISSAAPAGATPAPDLVGVLAAPAPPATNTPSFGELLGVALTEARSSTRGATEKTIGTVASAIADARSALDAATATAPDIRQAVLASLVALKGQGIDVATALQPALSALDQALQTAPDAAKPGIERAIAAISDVIARTATPAAAAEPGTADESPAPAAPTGNATGPAAPGPTARDGRTDGAERNRSRRHAAPKIALVTDEPAGPPPVDVAAIAAPLAPVASQPATGLGATSATTVARLSGATADPAASAATGDAEPGSPTLDDAAPGIGAARPGAESNAAGPEGTATAPPTSPARSVRRAATATKATPAVHDALRGAGRVGRLDAAAAASAAIPTVGREITGADSPTSPRDGASSASTGTGLPGASADPPADAPGTASGTAVNLEAPAAVAATAADHPAVSSSTTGGLDSAVAAQRRAGDPRDGAKGDHQDRDGQSARTAAIDGASRPAEATAPDAAFGSAPAVTPVAGRTVDPAAPTQPMNLARMERAADQVVLRVVDRLRAGGQATPGIDARLQHPDLGEIRLLVAGRVGEIVQAQLVTGDTASAAALAHAADRWRHTGDLAGVNIQVRAESSASPAFTGGGTHAGGGAQRDAASDARDDAALRWSLDDRTPTDPTPRRERVAGARRRVDVLA